MGFWHRPTPSTNPWKGKAARYADTCLFHDHCTFDGKKSPSNEMEEKDVKLAFYCMTCWSLPPIAGDTSPPRVDLKKRKRDVPGEPTTLRETEFFRVMSERLSEPRSLDSKRKTKAPPELYEVIPVELMDEVEGFVSSLPPTPVKRRKYDITEDQKKHSRVCERDLVRKREEWERKFVELTEMASSTTSRSQRVQTKLDLANLNVEWRAIDV